MVDSTSKANINVRSASYWIAHATAECSCCHAGTPLIALALPPQHQSLAHEWDSEEEELAECSWEAMEWCAFIFYVEYLPEEIRLRLQAASAGYRFAFSERTQGSYWANHCANCAALMEDHDLFCEPDGAFLPIPFPQALRLSVAHAYQPCCIYQPQLFASHPCQRLHPFHVIDHLNPLFL